MRVTVYLFAVAGVCAVPMLGSAQHRTVEQQIADAVRALPEGAREGAAVLAYRVGDDLELAREGTNPFVCLADPQGDLDFRASCYHRDLDPFMARGRELRSQGLNNREIREARKADVDAGRLEMPQRASMTTITGSINPATGVPDSVQVLTVLYLPFATTDDTGLPLQPGAGPWLMDAGQHRTHVMIPGPMRAF